MRITRQQLRKIIQEMAWDPSAPPYAHPYFVDIEDGDTPRSVRRTQDYQAFLDDEENSGELRALGLLSYEESEREKQILRDYHEDNKEEIKKFYNELKKSPESARITCLHAPLYEGGFTQKEDDSLFSWVNRFGRSGKDQISTVMIPGNITEMHKYFTDPMMSGGQNAEQIQYSPSFVMSGYPTIMHYEDMMTQTLSNLHPDLVKFQANSGVTKSPFRTPSINNFEQFLKDNSISEETVLDNWRIKGAHISINRVLSGLNLNSREQKEVIQDEEARAKVVIDQCTKLGIPLWVTYVEENKTVRAA